jgi:uncharacterized membrane protein YphA (DoxX/SURF4 family)
MESTERSKLRIVGAVMLWALIVLEVLGMGLAGLAKFQGDQWQDMFVGWGYAAWFALVVGAAEVVGALVLFVPRFASYAASMLIVIMLGAIGTVLWSTYESGLGAGVPMIHIVALSIILFARRKRRWRPD